MENKYLTLENVNEDKINIRKSVFISTGKEVINHQQAMEFLATVKSKYPDANHHCWAYIIGENQVNDDAGEPPGTAGPPILNVLKRNHLNNTIVVVTRYFGGKKLGVRGLIDAYREAAEKLLENSNIVVKKPGFVYQLTCDYNYANKLISIKDSRIKVLEHEFTDMVNIEVFVEADAVLEYEADFTGNNIKIKCKTESIN